LTEVAAGSSRMQRLGSALATAIGDLDTALSGVQSAVAARGQTLDALAAAVARTETATSEAARAITEEQRARRAGTMAAQASLQVSVLWTSFGACLLGGPRHPAGSVDHPPDRAPGGSNGPLG
jgi:hypothetical protein